MNTTIRWTTWCLYALAAFQLLIAVLLILDWDDTVTSFAGESFAPTRDAAEGAAVGSLGIHVLLAIFYTVVAARLPAGRRGTRVRATILLSLTVVGGLVTLFAIADETPLNPVGIVLAAATLVLLWLPAQSRAHFARVPATTL
ncbi:hypothetical protein [Actinophytocola oryzae]|uniref:Uncharacterized protein n=1 Tax=Actinophytocola oryzae TaxID=502181 RepID=A0A4R7VI03_9PSEU|nr:hypothetical protein [Actinophytocola oryzae]TDV48996.1 hypothetical protein CLV71_108357 [Actinophytocola oryzae]